MEYGGGTGFYSSAHLLARLAMDSVLQNPIALPPEFLFFKMIRKIIEWLLDFVCAKYYPDLSNQIEQARVKNSFALLELEESRAELSKLNLKRDSIGREIQTQLEKSEALQLTLSFARASNAATEKEIEAATLEFHNLEQKRLARRAEIEKLSDEAGLNLEVLDK